ncbi:MAG: Antitoxin component of toxin-antitoxin stability system, DNA-binding transcriptional repressor [Chloroflexi bacterium]|jgi:prevent-host-death family protein|nr:MAG: Antitoxin component of toxin-antitoxin stability system, DNA-binding transcriptional repressor [Chloroflexota bacterium]
MPEVGVRELKAHTSEILRRLRETKETVTVTYRGRAIARLVPVEDLESRKAEARAVLAEIEELAQELDGLWPPGVSAVEAVREQRREL